MLDMSNLYCNFEGIMKIMEMRFPINRRKSIIRKITQKKSGEEKKKKRKRTKTWHSLSPTNTSKKNTYTQNDSHRTSAEHWQKTLNL